MKVSVKLSVKLPAACGRRILLIDDNDDARELMATGLELHGHAVVTAPGGARGLREEWEPVARLPLQGPSRHL